MNTRKSPAYVCLRFKKSKKPQFLLVNRYQTSKLSTTLNIVLTIKCM